MSIVGIDTVMSNENELTAPTTSTTLGKDDFLLLLVAQLKSQDPLNPMEGTEFTAQLAQFSSLEQLNNINDNLEYLQLYQASINNSQAVALIGKTIKSSGNSIQLIDGVSDNVCFELAGSAKDVYIKVYDSSGDLVKVIEKGSLGAGEHVFKWDGTDDSGSKVSDGVYTFDIFAVDENEDIIDAATYTTGKVTGVNFKNGTTYLVVGNQEISIGDVVQVTETPSTPF